MSARAHLPPRLPARRLKRRCAASGGRRRALAAVLQGSKSQTGGEVTNGKGGIGEESIRYTLTTPQYHGPSRESIAAAAKTIELELNCYPSSNEHWDDTVAIVATESCLRGVESLLVGSVKRCGGSCNPTKSDGTLAAVAESLETATNNLKMALENEASIGCTFISDALSKMEAELKAK